MHYEMLLYGFDPNQSGACVMVNRSRAFRTTMSWFGIAQRSGRSAGD